MNALIYRIYHQERFIHVSTDEVYGKSEVSCFALPFWAYACINTTINKALTYCNHHERFTPRVFTDEVTARARSVSSHYCSVYTCITNS
jgi:hypothetical protein